MGDPELTRDSCDDNLISKIMSGAGPAMQTPKRQTHARVDRLAFNCQSAGGATSGRTIYFAMCRGPGGSRMRVGHPTCGNVGHLLHNPCCCAYKQRVKNRCCDVFNPAFHCRVGVPAPMLLRKIRIAETSLQVV